jgi:hypothetical protein
MLRRRNCSEVGGSDATFTIQDGTIAVVIDSMAVTMLINV